MLQKLLLLVVAGDLLLVNHFDLFCPRSALFRFLLSKIFWHWSLDFD